MEFPELQVSADNLVIAASPVGAESAVFRGLLVGQANAGHSVFRAILANLAAAVFQAIPASAACREQRASAVLQAILASAQYQVFQGNQASAANLVSADLAALELAASLDFLELGCPVSPAFQGSQANLASAANPVLVLNPVSPAIQVSADFLRHLASADLQDFLEQVDIAELDSAVSLEFLHFLARPASPD